MFVLAVGFYGRFVNRPYGTEQNIICRDDHILAKQVCYEAKRNIESPVTLFAFTKSLPQWGKVAAEG